MTLHSHTEHSSAAGAPPAWLASLLLRRDDILPRFAFHYRRLARQSRPWRRQLRRKLAMSVSGAALLLALAGPVGGPAVEAAADNVITVVNAEVRVANNGKCSLSEAIRNANNTTNGRPHADCAAGNPTGPDTINLPANGTFTLTAAENTGDFGPNGLPWIGSAVTINGNGAVIQRNPSAPEFRILAIGPNGNLTLNSATISGGAGYGGVLNQGALKIENSAILDNESYYWDGGGLHNSGSASILNSVISGNSTYGHYLSGGCNGGGIFSVAGELTIVSSTISNNVADGVYGGSFGGGVYGKNITITDSTISGNSAWLGAGVYFTGDARIETSLVTGNVGSGSGAAILNKGNTVVTNSTISANYSAGSGAIHNEATLRILNSTITENTVSSPGTDTGGLIAGTRHWQYEGVDYFSCSSTVVERSIISGNQGEEVSFQTLPEATCSSTFTVNRHNIFGDAGNSGLVGVSPGSTDIVPTVPLSALLSPLTNNGGPTQTHALPSGSPAIDRAPSAACTADPVSGVDQRGQPRNANGAGGVTGQECDVGAFEFQPTAAGPKLLISPATAGTVGGVAFTPADILQYDPAANAWSLYFKASRVGVTKNLAAFEVLDGGDILMSFVANQPISGVGTFAPQDVARFHPTATGPNTAGTFAWYLDGSTRGLSTAGEKIDALAETEEGFPALSVTGAASVPRLNGSVQKAQDEDALGYNPSNGGWWLAFDGTAVPGLGVEDVNALWRDPSTGDLYVSIIGAFNLSGIKGDGKDIVKLSPDGSGGYTPSLFWDGSAAGFPSNVDGLEMIP